MTSQVDILNNRIAELEYANDAKEKIIASMIAENELQKGTTSILGYCLHDGSLMPLRAIYTRETRMGSNNGNKVTQYE